MHTSAAAPALRARSIDRVAVGVERGVGEMDVTVDELQSCMHEPPRAAAVRRTDIGERVGATAHRPARAAWSAAAARALALRGARTLLVAAVRGHLCSIQRRIGAAT